MLQHVPPGLYIEQFLPGIWSGESNGVTTMLELKYSILQPFHCNPILSFFCCVSGRFRKNVYRIHNIFGAQTLVFLTWFQFYQRATICSRFQSLDGSTPPKKHLFLKKWVNSRRCWNFANQKKRDFWYFCESIHHPIPSTWVLEGCCNGRFEAWLVCPTMGSFQLLCLLSWGLLRWRSLALVLDRTKGSSSEPAVEVALFRETFQKGEKPEKMHIFIKEAGFSSKPRIGILWICKKQGPKTIVTKALNSIVRGLVCFTKPQRSDGEALALAEGRRVIFDICWGATPELFVYRRFCMHWHLLFLISSSISVNWPTMPWYFVVQHPYCREKRVKLRCGNSTLTLPNSAGRKKVVKHVFTQWNRTTVIVNI